MSQSPISTAPSAELPPPAAIHAMARCLVGLSCDTAGLPDPYCAILARLEASDRARRSTVLMEELQKHGLGTESILQAISRTDPEAPPPPPRRRSVFSADELLRANFPEPRWAIPGLVPEGLTILGGRPKMGKSWWALEASLAVGAGGRFMGQDVPRGSVVFFSLEDSPKRLQWRMKSINWPPGLDVTFCHDLAPIGGTLVGLVPLIEEKKPTLVVVDTLSRAAQGLDQRNVGMVTDYLSPIQATALAAGCAVLVIDHHRKPKIPGAHEDTDPVDELMESSAKGAVADAVIGIFRKRGERGATLKVVGRDMEDQVLAIEMDPVTCSWQLLGDAEEVRRSDRVRKILAALRSVKGTSNAQTISEMTGIPKNHISATFNDLVEQGVLRRLEKIGREVPYQLVEGTGLESESSAWWTEKGG